MSQSHHSIAWCQLPFPVYHVPISLLVKNHQGPYLLGVVADLDHARAIPLIPRTVEFCSGQPTEGSPSFGVTPPLREDTKDIGCAKLVTKFQYR